MICSPQPPAAIKMTFWDVYVELRKHGSNLAKVGRGLDPPVTRNHVRRVLRGERRSQRVEEALAQAAGMTREEFIRRRKAA